MISRPDAHPATVIRLDRKTKFAIRLAANVRVKLESRVDIAIVAPKITTVSKVVLAVRVGLRFSTSERNAHLVIFAAV